MSLDIRIPIGFLFLILGILLVIFGLVTFKDLDLYERSLHININLWWGVVMVVFGALMAYFGYRSPRVQPVPAPTTEDASAPPRPHG